MDDGIRVQVDGLRELRRDLKGLDRGANRELSKALKEGLAPIIGRARAQMGASFKNPTGVLAASLRPYAAGTKAGIRSRLPYSPVQHWGGRVYPKGGEVRIPRTEFLTKAIKASGEWKHTELAEAIDKAARKNGWH